MNWIMFEKCAISKKKNKKTNLNSQHGNKLNISGQILVSFEEIFSAGGLSQNIRRSGFFN